MAINWRPGNPASPGISIKLQVLLACLLAAMLFVLINWLSSHLTEGTRGKIRPNQIVSPWDRSQIPPVLGSSPVVTPGRNAKPKAVTAEPNRITTNRPGRVQQARR